MDMEDTTTKLMSRALGGDIPFLPARADFNLFDVILIQPHPEEPMVCSEVNLLVDSPPDLAMQIEALRNDVRHSSSGAFVLNCGEAAKRTIEASFGSAAATAALSNWQQSDFELELSIGNVQVEKIMHGNSLQTFLDRNIGEFLEANLAAVGNEVLGGEGRGTQRMALGFVAKCSKAQIVMSQRVKKASSNRASGQAGTGLQSVQAGGGLENSNTGTSAFFNANPAVVGVKLFVCLLEKRPSDNNFRLGFATVHGPDSPKLRDTISWVGSGRMRKKLVQAMEALAQMPRMPTTARPTFMIPRHLPLDEDTFDIASDGVRDDEIVDGDMSGVYGHAVLVLEDHATGAAEVVATTDPAEIAWRIVGSEGDITEPENRDPECSWRSSYKTKVKVKKDTLRRMYLALKKDGYYPLPGGVRLVGMAPAFPSSMFIPIIYKGNAGNVPRAVLRSNGLYDYLVPVEGGNCDKVVTNFEFESWEVREYVRTVEKSETDQIRELEVQGFYKVEPVEFDDSVDPEQYHIMARQELRQKVFRTRPIGNVDQSKIELATAVMNSPLRKSQKTDRKPHA
jgi:hypothetical protein